MKSLLKWWLIFCLTLIGLGASIHFGIHKHLYESDVTRLSYVILFIFACTSIWIGGKTYQVSVKEDYGQSLATYGFGPGCYLVLPVLGPSTARDTVASLTNFMGGDAWYNVTVRNDTHYFRDVDYYS